MSANKFANIFEDKQQHDGQYDKQENELIQQSQQKNPVITDYHDATDPATGILLRHLDPRPDIEADHEDWVDMLQNCLVWAGLKDGKKLWGVLHGLRCGGARIQRVKGELGYKLLPGNEDWKQEAEWQRIRKEYLDGVKDDLVSLFKMTKEHGRMPRMEEIWPEGDGDDGLENKPERQKNKAEQVMGQTKLF